MVRESMYYICRKAIWRYFNTKYTKKFSENEIYLVVE